MHRILSLLNVTSCQGMLSLKATQLHLWVVSYLPAKADQGLQQHGKTESVYVYKIPPCLCFSKKCHHPNPFDHGFIIQTDISQTNAKTK